MDEPLGACLGIHQIIQSGSMFRHPATLWMKRWIWTPATLSMKIGERGLDPNYFRGEVESWSEIFTGKETA